MKSIYSIPRYLLLATALTALPTFADDTAKAVVGGAVGGAGGAYVGEKMGGDTIWLGYVSSDMPSTEEFARRLETYFEDENVDLVITHWRGSMHPRHINTYDAVTTAVKRLREKGSPIRLMYGETFEDLVGFIPQAYFTVNEDVYGRWQDALKTYDVYRGEVNSFPYQPYYTTIGQVRQIESNNSDRTAAYMYASLIENDLW